MTSPRKVSKAKLDIKSPLLPVRHQEHHLLTPHFFVTVVALKRTTVPIHETQHLDQRIELSLSLTFAGNLSSIKDC